MENLPVHKKAVLALIIANIIWGTASPIFKWSLSNIPPFSLAFLRFYYGSIILLIVVLFTNLAKTPGKTVFQVVKEVLRKDLKDLFLISFCGIFFNIIFYFWGLKISAAINAPIIGSAGPVFTFILAVIFLKEKFKIKRFTGMMISLAGVLFIVIQPLLTKKTDSSLLGNFFFILATLGAVGQSIFGRRFFPKYNFLVITLLSFIVGTILFFPLAVFELKADPGWFLRLNDKGYIGIVFGALLSSVLAYSLFGYGLSKLQASQATIFTYIDPLAAIMIAIPLLHEIITPEFIAGSVLVFSGIYLAEKRIHYHPINLLRSVSAATLAPRLKKW